MKKPRGRDDEKAAVSVGEWGDQPKPEKRTFPGPRGVDSPLRVAMEKEPYADVTAHAHESLDAEICGVLAGAVCEDDEGVFVHVQAAIRGASARESNARVTFTQETWNAVHETLERRYPDLRIVGWYHSHPGFGVEFSEMDVFIQKNFFPSPAQIALVTDPLGGDTAICRNAGKGVEYLDEFWVDGRGHSLRVPTQRGAAAARSSAGAITSTVGAEADLKSMEARLAQVIQAVDEQRRLFRQFLTILLVGALAGIVAYVGFAIYEAYTSQFTPPQLNGYVPIPVKIGDKTVMIGIGVVQWDVPPELNAIELELAKKKQAANPSPSPAQSPSQPATQ
jgi:proteasome lid subunit RPN8/RPN11